MKRLFANTLIVGLVAAASLVMAPSQAEACSCLPPNLAESYNWHTDVMRVRVLRSIEYRGRFIHQAYVRDVYKGCAEEGSLVLLISDASGAACGIRLNRGNHLITANAMRRDRRYTIGSCGYNRRFRDLSDAEVDWLNRRYVCCGDDCGCFNDDEVACFADPCTVSSCPEGSCTANYCGGCWAEYENDAGQAVCNACESDDDCAWNQVCTEAGCLSSESLSLWNTCGDPVCGGFRDDPELPPCLDDVAVGDGCDTPGVVCEWGDGCNTRLTCAATDPRLRGCPISRLEYKRDVDYLEDGELAALRDGLMDIRLATWNYNEDAAERPARLGFIIEDVEPSPSVDSERDMVDLYGYLSMAVAAIQTQEEELRTLRAQVEALNATRQMCE